jgi:hypothetical protein
MREFRENLAGYLEAGTPLAIMRHGKTLGFYTAQKRDRKAQIEVFERAEPLISRRRQQTAFRTGTDAGPLRGRRRWHVGTERCGTGEALPGSHVGQRPWV